MAIKKVPLRQCTGCGEMKSKKEMYRIIKAEGNEIFLDTTGKKNGRGAYICKSLECFAKVKKTKALERSLKVSIPEEVYEVLAKELNEVEKSG